MDSPDRRKRSRPSRLFSSGIQPPEQGKNESNEKDEFQRPWMVSLDSSTPKGGDDPKDDRNYDRKDDRKDDQKDSQKDGHSSNDERSPKGYHSPSPPPPLPGRPTSTTSGESTPPPVPPKMDSPALSIQSRSSSRPPSLPPKMPSPALSALSKSSKRSISSSEVPPPLPPDELRSETTGSLSNVSLASPLPMPHPPPAESPTSSSLSYATPPSIQAESPDALNSSEVPPPLPRPPPEPLSDSNESKPESFRLPPHSASSESEYEPSPIVEAVILEEKLSPTLPVTRTSPSPVLAKESPPPPSPLRQVSPAHSAPEESSKVGAKVIEEEPENLESPVPAPVEGPQVPAIAPLTESPSESSAQESPALPMRESPASQIIPSPVIESFTESSIQESLALPIHESPAPPIPREASPSKEPDRSSSQIPIIAPYRAETKTRVSLDEPPIKKTVHFPDNDSPKPKPKPMVIGPEVDRSGLGQVDIEAQQPIEERKQKSRSASLTFGLILGTILLIGLVALLVWVITNFA